MARITGALYTVRQTARGVTYTFKPDVRVSAERFDHTDYNIRASITRKGVKTPVETRNFGFTVYQAAHQQTHGQKWELLFSGRVFQLLLDWLNTLDLRPRDVLRFVLTRGDTTIKRTSVVLEVVKASSVASFFLGRKYVLSAESCDVEISNAMGAMIDQLIKSFIDQS